MARKLNKKLLTLGSAAAITVYAVGFVRSSGLSTAGGSAPSAVTAQPANGSTTADAATAIAQAVAAATPAPAASISGTTTAAAYRDGTFTGSGTSRFGGFDVAVTIKGGRITGVELTRVTTRYPASRIAKLPGEVVDRQSAGVDIVSGASYSSRAFWDAVAQALAQAATGAVQQG